MPVKKRKKLRLGSSAHGCNRRRAEAPNAVRCWDYVFDTTASSSQRKWLSIVDEYMRECLALKVDGGTTSEDVIDTLSELFAMRGVPWHIRSDNGPGFITRALRRWLGTVGVSTLYVELGRAWENGYAESFFCTLPGRILGYGALRGRPGCPDAHGLLERRIQHPGRQSSLGYRTPAGFAAASAASTRAKVSAPAAHAGCLGQFYSGTLISPDTGDTGNPTRSVTAPPIMLPFVAQTPTQPSSPAVRCLPPPMSATPSGSSAVCPSR